MTSVLTLTLTLMTSALTPTLTLMMSVLTLTLTLITSALTLTLTLMTSALTPKTYPYGLDLLPQHLLELLLHRVHHLRALDAVHARFLQQVVLQSQETGKREHFSLDVIDTCFVSRASAARTPHTHARTH